MITSISDTQRLRQITIDTGTIYIIEVLNDDNTWMVADSSTDNTTVIKRMVEWGLAKDQRSALDLINRDHNAVDCTG